MFSGMSEAEAMFNVLRQSADATPWPPSRALVRDAPDHALSRINVLDFAAKRGLNEERAIAAFLHASRIGLFELSWNVLCPGCGGVLDANATLKSVHREEYECALCAAGYEPTLDEMVEVVFTVTPRVRRIAAHDPSTLPIWRILPPDLLGLRASTFPTTSNGSSRTSPSIRSSCRPARKRSCRCSCRRSS